MGEVVIKRRRQLTVRLTDYENRRLEVLRRIQVPVGARPRPAGACMVEAVLRVVAAMEREADDKTQPPEQPGDPSAPPKK